jgi:hypothetical protein
MKAKKPKIVKTTVKPKCGLCGKSRKLTKTDCCGNWICDDQDKYVIFSYARNSCYRNHNHYTLCAYHHTEEHGGDWKTCHRCRRSFVTEIYVWYGTNEYNFEKLPNPPAYEPTKCSQCGEIIVLSEDEYSVLGKEYFCEDCTEKRLTQRGDEITEDK